MVEKINIGKVAITIGGEYDSLKQYEKLTCVVYKGKSWVSRTDVPEGVLPDTNDSYWQLISERGEKGDKGDKGDTGERGEKGETGNSGYSGTADELEVVNNLTQGGATKALSAEQGKVLDTKLTELDVKFDEIDTRVDVLEKGVDISKLTPIVYADLVSLRDNGELIAGGFYRITDYITTTAQVNTLSAGHFFDVIVLALSENTLAEEAYAIQSVRDVDGYFSESNLAAWKLWYSLDNDTTRFAWADAENGKGVIYRMIDEWNNDIPYDFKNIQYEDKQGFTYTFAEADDLKGWCYGNEINPYLKNGVQNLNKIYFGIGCHSNIFGNTCHSNSFGDYCYSNSFGNNCHSNSFDSDCNSNIFGDYCYSNIFGDYCYSNSFGYNCTNNSFGAECHSNIFGNTCTNNIFGDYCYSNSFDNDCTHNSFCATTSEDKGHYYRYNHLGNGVNNCIFTNSATASYSQCVQNYDVAQGLSDMTIATTRNLAYETKVALTTSGDLKRFNPADIA